MAEDTREDIAEDREDIHDEAVDIGEDQMDLHEEAQENDRQERDIAELFSMIDSVVSVMETVLERLDRIDANVAGFVDAGAVINETPVTDSDVVVFDSETVGEIEDASIDEILENLDLD